MTRRTAVFVTSWVIAILFVWIGARAQETSRSPHGDLAGECSTCHTAEGWSPLRKPLPFDHQGTGFALRAAHAQTSCRGCHKSLVFSQVGTACADCHGDAHRGELGPQCESCHRPESWTNRTEFARVHTRTRFPLLAAHAGVDCESCHRGQQPREFVNTPTECVACHLANFQGTRNPDHQRLGFSRRCADCHGAAARTWQGALFGPGFAHPATFALTGAHARTACSSCHANGRFQGTSRECVSCHRADFDRTTNPNHRSSGFATECQGCHGTAAWRPAAFDHRAFPLSGGHAGVECSSCHVGGRFQGTSRECVSCHRPDYDRAQNPNHRSSGFPTSCESCHVTSAWRPATFDHDRFFPLSGDHGGIPCATCHVNPQNVRVFECTGCHRRNDTDGEHDDVPGYRYDSPSCYRCHPRGRE